MQCVWVCMPCPVWTAPPPQYVEKPPLRTASSPCRLENPPVVFIEDTPCYECNAAVCKEDSMCNDATKMEEEACNDKATMMEDDEEVCKATFEIDHQVGLLEKIIKDVQLRTQSSRAARRHAMQKKQRALEKEVEKVAQEKQDMEALFEASSHKAEALQKELQAAHAELLSERTRLLAHKLLAESNKKVEGEIDILRKVARAQKHEIRMLQALCDERASQVDMEQRKRAEETAALRKQVEQLSKLCRSLCKNKSAAAAPA